MEYSYFIMLNIDLDVESMERRVVKNKRINI